MIKDIIHRNESATASDSTLEVLHRHFPECFSREGRFDIEKFKARIGQDTAVSKEGYGLSFLGRGYAQLLAATDTTTYIVPDGAHNSLPENAASRNIYISGDNLDGLKHLLKSYARRVKCIYIDPPYNTGTDGFAYCDNFNFTPEELQTKLGIGAEEAARILDMTSRGSASHSAWLMFMMPRLMLARDLLADDGVIFISIDDNEQANLKLLCDNIFGEENFIFSAPRITKRGGKSSDAIALNHDYLLSYSKTSECVLYPINHDDPGFKNKDDFFDKRGFYKLNQTLDYDSLQYSNSLDYPIELDGQTFYPGGSEEAYKERKSGRHDRADWCWRWSPDKFKFGLENGFIEVKTSRNGTRIYTKTYQNANIEEGDNGYYIEYGDRTKALSTLEFTDNTYSNDNATKDLARTMPKKIFDYTKPVSLIQTILDLSVRGSDIVVDFFSGSGTTAEAIMKWNARTGNSVRYIMVQLPEPTKSRSLAEREGFNTIDEIGLCRISRSAKAAIESGNAPADYGFKHYTLKEPSDKTLEMLENFDPTVFFTDNDVLREFGPEAVLETWRVRDGYGFGSESTPVKLDTYTAHLTGKHLYMLDGGLTEDDMVALADLYLGRPDFNPENVVLFGYSFAFTETDMLRRNLVTLSDSMKNLKVNIDIRY